MQKFNYKGVPDMKKLHRLQHPFRVRKPGMNSSLDRDEIRCFAIAIWVNKRMPRIPPNCRLH